MSEWINIDKLGSRGMEPDMMPSDRDPQSLDIAVNMRSSGTNLANAGGYDAVPFGDIPDEVVASNCSPCPTIYLSSSTGDGTTKFDRSWNWDQNDTKHYLCALEINKAQQDYDQTIRTSSGECNNFLQERTDVEVLNTPGNRRIKVLKYNSAGVITDTKLDYDADSIFGDGNPHWVIVEQYYSSGSNISFKIWIDSTQIYGDSHLHPQLSRFTSVIRGNSPAGIVLPVAFWRFSQTLLDCLTSGNFNGFGRCLPVEQSEVLAFDSGITDPDLDLYVDERIATPKVGTPTRRTAYLDHGTASGKVYYEVVRDPGPCRSDGYYIGGILRGSTLGTNTPGQASGSWGYTGPTGRLQVDGLPDQAIGFITIKMSRLMVALDLDLNLLYLGGGETDSPEWIGGGTPGSGASSWDIGVSGSDMQALYTFFDTNEAVNILSSAESCRQIPPSGFGYLQQP